MNVFEIVVFPQGLGRFEKDNIMFDDLFNFGKERSLKQSVGFYLFYVCIFMGFSGFMTLLGF